MIQPLRATHRRAFIVLAILLPAVIVGGLQARHPEVRPNTLVVPAPATTQLVRKSDTLWSNTRTIKAELHRDSSHPGGVFVVIRSTAELADPDLLVYWSQDQPDIDSLPTRASLLGPFVADRPFFLPSNSGYLILFSLAHQSVVDTANVEALP